MVGTASASVLIIATVLSARFEMLCCLERFPMHPYRNVSVAGLIDDTPTGSTAHGRLNTNSFLIIPGSMEVEEEKKKEEQEKQGEKEGEKR
ncbi:hypothetical protein ALC62_11929 [Cyphomyrmex costatus]|uniref:Secreted protein n=1 Tax=Cyphomyrmex costatus TaxID=456900 RepID=A0A195C9V0_9HYME|nr:hypothetical protein ALC62_11929 [Cyphomyrmex costatus]